MPAHGGRGGAGSPRTPRPGPSSCHPSLPAAAPPLLATRSGEGTRRGQGRGPGTRWARCHQPCSPSPPGTKLLWGTWGTRRSPVKPSWHELVAKGCPQAQGQLQAASSPEAAEPPKPHTGCGRLLPPTLGHLSQLSTAPGAPQTSSLSPPRGLSHTGRPTAPPNRHLGAVVETGTKDDLCQRLGGPVPGAQSRTGSRGPQAARSPHKGVILRASRGSRSHRPRYEPDTGDATERSQKPEQTRGLFLPAAPRRRNVPAPGAARKRRPHPLGVPP